jgi:hypothetical protein
MMRIRFGAVAAGCLSIGLAAIAQDSKLEAPTVDEKAGTVTFSGKACKTDVYEQLKGMVEFAIVMPKGKAYESLFEAPVDPIKLNDALKKIGAKSGKPATDEKNPATGDKIRISIQWKAGEQERTEPIEKFIHDVETKKPMETPGWIFQGSKEGFVPELGDMGLLVLANKNLIGLYQGEGACLLTNSAPLMSGHRYKVNKDLHPKEGTPVKFVMQLAK